MTRPAPAPPRRDLPLLGLDPRPYTGEAELRGGTDVLFQLALPGAGRAGHGGDLGIVGRTEKAVSAAIDAIGLEYPPAPTPCARCLVSGVPQAP